MKEVDKKVLREAAVNCKHAGETPFMPFDQRMAAFDEFKRLFTPNVQLALLDELEAAESKCRELAAENAGLKELIEQHANSVSVCPNCSHEEPSETDDIVALYRAMETPATDAFLAEVRAQGVEMAAQSDQFSTWVQQGLRSFAIGVRQGDDFAAQLRKGAAL